MQHEFKDITLFNPHLARNCQRSRVSEIAGAITLVITGLTLLIGVMCL